jgi:hypothetical protein
LKIPRYPLAPLALALIRCAQGDKKEIALANLSFEKAPQTRDEIPGWGIAQHAGPLSYEMSTDSEVHS